MFCTVVSWSVCVCLQKQLRSIPMSTTVIKLNKGNQWCFVLILCDFNQPFPWRLMQLRETKQNILNKRGSHCIDTWFNAMPHRLGVNRCISAHAPGSNSCKSATVCVQREKKSTSGKWVKEHLVACKVVREREREKTAPLNYYGNEHYYSMSTYTMCACFVF